MADIDQTVALDVKPPTAPPAVQAPDIVGPLTAFANVQLANANAQRVGLEAQRQAISMGGLQAFRQNTAAGQPFPQAIGPLMASDPATADNLVKAQQGLQNYTSNQNFAATGDPSAVMAQGPDAYSTAMTAIKTQGDIAQKHAENMGRVGDYVISGMDPNTGAIPPAVRQGAVQQALQMGLINSDQAKMEAQMSDQGFGQIAHAWAAAGQAANDYANNSGAAAGAQTSAKNIAQAKTGMQILSPGQVMEMSPGALQASRAAPALPTPGMSNGQSAAAPASPLAQYAGASASPASVGLSSLMSAVPIAQQNGSAPVLTPDGQHTGVKMSPTRDGSMRLSPLISPDDGAAPPVTIQPPPQTSSPAPSARSSQPPTGGMSPAGLTRTAQIESGGNPNAVNGNALGLMQFEPATWKQFGQGSPLNPADAVAAAGRLSAANAQQLAPVLGRPPTDAELYLAHQQGAQGAAKLLANPNARAGDLVGDAAIRSNGGNPNAPASAFTSKWISKFNNGAPLSNMPTMAGAVTPTPQNFLPGSNTAPVRTVATIPAVPLQSPLMSPTPIAQQGGAGGPATPAAALPPPAGTVDQSVAARVNGARPQQPTTAPASPQATLPPGAPPGVPAGSGWQAGASGPSLYDQHFQEGLANAQVDQYKQAQEGYQSAQQGQQSLQQLQKSLTDVQGGSGLTNALLAPGTGAAERVGWAKAINTAASMAGLSPIVDPNKISAAEDAQKITGRLGFDTSRTLGSREAQSIVQQSIHLNPGMENTPQGAQVVAASINAALQRQKDLYQFMSQSGNRPGTDIAFDRAHPVSQYVGEARALANVPQQAVDILQSRGSDPRVAQFFDAKYGSGLSRYFIGGGQ